MPAMRCLHSCLAFVILNPWAILTSAGVCLQAGDWLNQKKDWKVAQSGDAGMWA